MSIEQTPHGDIVITGSASISLYRLLVLRAALALELKGLRVSRGRTAYSILKGELDLKGSRESVLAQVTLLLEQQHANPGSYQKEQ